MPKSCNIAKKSYYLAQNTTTNRIAKTSLGTELMLGVGGFAGVEYFVAPKLSISGQVGLRLQYGNTGKNKVTKESWNGSTILEDTTETGGANDFNISTRYSSAITLMFHF